VDQLLEAGETAMDPDQNLKGMTARFKAGEKHPDFLLKLSIVRANAMEDGHMEPLEAYFDTQKDWGTPDNMELLFTYTDDLDSPLFDYFAKNRSDFELLFGRETVAQKLQYLVNQKLYEGAADALDLGTVDEIYGKAYPDMAEKLSANFRVDYYRMAGDQEKFLAATINYIEKFQPDDAMELNNAAWNFFELVEDHEQLKLALKWAQRSVDLEPGYYNHDTLAALYFKLGQKKKAIKTAKEAIRIAEAEGEDASATEALLDAIRSN
jgi:tetratricopeptide (TPR) repeat protein